MKKITIVMDGISYEVEIADALASSFETNHAKIRDDAAALPEVKGKLLAAEKSADDLKVKLDAANDPATVAGAIAARTKVIQDAKRIAPELQIDEKADDKAIKVAALVANGHEAAEFEKCDAAFVDGCFAGALRTAPAAGPAPTLQTVPGPILRTDATDPKTAEQLKTPINATGCTPEHADAARERMIARNRDMSAGDLDMSKKTAQAPR